MRSKLLISTAALLAGVALASAQSMQGEQRGGAAQGPQSQSSPKQSPSQDGMQGTQDRSQRGQAGQATGQAQPESGAQQGKQGQSQQRSQGQKQRDQTSGQGSQREQGQTGQSQQGQTQPGRAQPSQTQPSQTQSGQAPQQGQTQQGQTQQGQAGQAGQAGGSANLTTEQRTRVRETVLTGSNVPRVNNVNFTLSVGTTVPTRVRVVAVPPPLIEIYPQWRGHMYFVVGDQIIIVDRSHRIVAVINV